PLTPEEELLLLRVELVGALLHPSLQILEPPDLLPDRREVRQHPPEPALRHVDAAATLRLLLDDRAALTLRAHEQDAVPLERHLPGGLLRLSQELERLLEVDDVDAVPLREDVLPHLRVPAAGLVPEMDTCLEELSDLGFDHSLACLVFRVFTSTAFQRLPPGSRDPGR